MITTVSLPPKAVSKTVCPAYLNPSPAAWFISFCMVDVLLVANSLY